MKKLLFFLFIILFSCNKQPVEQKKAEKLVEIYLDSLNDNSKKVEIIEFGDVYPIFNSFADDPNYEKFKHETLKSDSIKRHFKAQITSWVVYVSFKGKDAYGTLGTHNYQCWIDKNFSRCYVGIEVDCVY